MHVLLFIFLSGSGLIQLVGYIPVHVVPDGYGRDYFPNFYK